MLDILIGLACLGVILLTLPPLRRLASDILVIAGLVCMVFSFIGAVVFFFYQSDQFREIIEAVGLVLGWAVGAALAWAFFIYGVPYFLGLVGGFFTTILSATFESLGNFLAKIFNRNDRENN